MKILLIIALILLGLYWLVAHTAPLPFHHEQLGLYNHEVHRIVGIALLIGACVAAWKLNLTKK